MGKLRLWVSGILLVLGVACCHYTKPSGLKHHILQAEEHGWPPPSDATLLLGVAAVAVGGLGCGWSAANIRASKLASH